MSQRLAPAVAVALGCAVLVAGVMLYLQPDFVVTVANALWSCF